MHVLNLATRDGLRPTKASDSNERKYFSSCPGCYGKGCFIIWDAYNRYYCRQCQRRGDPVQYLRDFHAMSYNEACSILEILHSKIPHTELWRPPCDCGACVPSKKPIVILESELEAGLIEQFAGDICCPIALGGISPLILIAIQTQVVDWPSPAGTTGIELRKWVLDGIRYAIAL